ncbi:MULTISPECIES: cation diffusion facilitator family transporter [Pelosinus]|uniref:Cation diffusion facilitator family transporter n=2 Tax=Pelosinus TaxID=365348 RepID=I9NUA5_9FIRM|nr:MULTISPECIES: cation diffusion facilitator family transporter [Pelosinus]AJQ30064.1 cation diffusion facilitator family transporter [Pelosinus fermentans JBW45]MCC5468196.1 cation diffusion facilitator family transporter [Pelosinus baikalensis]
MGYVDSNLKERTARLSVISNTVLVVLKLIVGFYTGAVSIISEAAHSGFDLLASLIAFYAVRKADTPPDDNHAYGHGKFENLSGAIEAILIIGAAVWIVYEAGSKMNSATVPGFLEYGIALMIISIAINYWVSERLFKVAKQTGSHALEADGLHLRADIWTSVGVLVGLVIIHVTGLAWLDPVIAIIVAGIVFKAGYGMTKKSLYELTDISLPAHEEQMIIDIIKSHKEIISFHQLRTRRSGSWRLIDMHLILYKDMHLNKAHDICDQIEEEIKQKLGSCDVVIHLEPCDHLEELGACPLDE